MFNKTLNLMQMEAKIISLVQESFEKIKPISASSAQAFYSKLFEIDPDIKPLFVSENSVMAEQEDTLIMMLTSMVYGLSRMEDLVLILRNLGKRYAAYNIKDSHYDTVGSALLYMLAIGLGNDFTSEVREAWMDAYDSMSAIVMQAS